MVTCSVKEKKQILAAALGSPLCACLAVFLPDPPLAARLLLAAAAVVLTAVALALGARAAKRMEAAVCEAQRRLQEAEKRGGEAEQRAREEAERRHLRTKEKLAAFYSKTSHSLRIPISVIQGYADLLSSGLIQDESVRREYLNKIRERTEYMNTVLGQLLTEARVQADFSVAVWDRFDLVELLRQIVGDMHEAAHRLGVDIQLEAEAHRLLFEGDRTRLTRALYNILENSLKYMNAAGKITVTLSLVEGKQVFLVFKDNGAGMDSEEAEHVFEINYRGSNSTGGNGMGLYLVYVTALAHHGSVSARSAPGKGMTIRMLLPVEQTAPQGERAP